MSEREGVVLMLFLLIFWAMVKIGCEILSRRTRTFQSVVKELVEGLEDGSIVLDSEAGNE